MFDGRTFRMLRYPAANFPPSAQGRCASGCAHTLTVPEGAEGLDGAKAGAVSELRISKLIMGKTIVLGLAVPSLSLANYLIN